MDLKLKVCGMKFRENIEQVVALRPDYMGLIFYEKSPRFVEEEVQLLDSSIKKTGVFVNASEEYILQKVEKYDLSAVQLHGDEPVQFCRDLKEKFSETNKRIEIIKVFSLKEKFDFQLLQAYEGIVDLFLFDTKGKSRGGNGILFDWQLLNDYSSSTPFFLSGGIGADEIDAIKDLYSSFQEKGNEMVFYGIDVNSRFETSPGLKNIDKLKSFGKELRS